MSSELIDMPIESEKSTPEFDAVIVLGKNLGINWNPKEIREQRFHLSPHSRINVLAAGILYKEGLTNTIIFSTGKTAGEDIDSEAALMKKHLLRIFPSIPETAVKLEEISWDTNTNGKATKKLLEKEGLRKVALLTTNFHLERARYLFKRAGIDIDDYFASDTWLQLSSPEFVTKYKKSELYLKEREREKKGLKIMEKPMTPDILSLLTGGRRKVGFKRLINGLTPFNI